MFRMTVKDAIVVGNNTLFFGKCTNRQAFKSPLFDTDGNKYDVGLTLDKDLVIDPEDISLGVSKPLDPKTLVGKELVAR